ncbi:Phosphatidylserine decarboxylase proenzyme [Enhygromyxa salina]|uniref:Phosphatidylserine decarboxylase proenzyme n=1 Tax=Enhygromyxa salina TaxID=215803 RepID=A0A2S9YFW1_9BACT|nr:phosphatidylserine decarboxylase [Enhygromyxa salina]PRQ04003.1 Phosphatidylserine decarboxylase proenzyme [Enhygromyxa salina]
MNDGIPPATEWTKRDKARVDALLAELDAMLVRPEGGMSATGALMQASLSEVCNPLLNPDPQRRVFWLRYRDNDKPMSAFFSAWLHYAPAPINPGLYIEQWDYLANTEAGLKLNNADKRFKQWFVRFLDIRGEWLSSTESTGTIEAWRNYQGTPAHPFDIHEYVVPPGGFESFNQFFLRQLKPGERPMCPCVAESSDGDPNVVVSPCDGGVFYLTRGELEGEPHPLPGKSQDTFEIERAVPGYGASFLGGPLLDILLWFTDYHHFRAPVSGTVIHQGVYEGSYNYDFDDYDPNDPYAPALAPDSDRVGWYQSLGKHKRYVWVFRTENLGLVAMIAIGFWGVGSIVNLVDEGATLTKGDRMGHFAYGGSSIVLAFEPNLDLQFAVHEVETKTVDGKTITETFTKPVGDPDHPTLMKIQQCLGRRTPPLKW